jgi:predicted negative regulator of RcsB-dependent stress response
MTITLLHHLYVIPLPVCVLVGLLIWLAFRLFSAGSDQHATAAEQSIEDVVEEALAAMRQERDQLLDQTAQFIKERTGT